MQCRSDRGNRVLSWRLRCPRTRACRRTPAGSGLSAWHSEYADARPGHSIIETKILVLHGDADPLAPFDQLAAFRDEMRSAQANWEIDIYGDARHSFTGEGVLDQNSPEAGLHPQPELRSWRATVEFLTEVLK
jgi:dienelactone hydrolase